MRYLMTAVLIAAGALLGWYGGPVAAADSTCGNLGGDVEGDQTCHVHASTSTYTLDMKFPRDYPDEQALTDYIAGRTGYDYNSHGKADNDHVDFVPDEIVDRFCILGSVDDHIAKLRELEAIGVTQWNIYLMVENPEETLELYGREIIPALREAGIDA